MTNAHHKCFHKYFLFLSLKPLCEEVTAASVLLYSQHFSISLFFIFSDKKMPVTTSASSKLQYIRFSSLFFYLGDVAFTYLLMSLLQLCVCFTAM